MKAVISLLALLTVLMLAASGGLQARGGLNQTERATVARDAGQVSARLTLAQTSAPGRPAPATATPRQAAPGLNADARQAVINKYCVSCHNQRTRTAGLALEALDILNAPDAAMAGEKVLRKLRGRTMPPRGMPRPDGATYDAVVASLETDLEEVAQARPNPGRPAIHRLNRAEYTNAIRDLLALEIDGKTFLPSDDSGYGFDNIGDVLSVSPALLDRYVSAARKITRLAIGDPTLRPVTEQYAVPAYLPQLKWMGEDLPFGSRGGVVVRHNFPLDGEYRVRIRLRKDVREVIRGLANQHQIDVRLDGARVATFTIGGRGKYEAYGAGAEAEYLRHADEALQVKFPVKAGNRKVVVTFQNRTSALDEGTSDPLPITSSSYTAELAGEPEIEGFDIFGPEGGQRPETSPSRRAIFVCYPTSSAADERCATEILSTFARRAYRRPVTSDELKTLVTFYNTGHAKGGFEAGIELGLRRVLISPQFLFRMERDPANMPQGAPYRINDLELASRLSFFLWSSIPDDELLALAERGKLNTPAVLEQQVRRMLRDRRSSAMVANFAGQWLQLRNVQGVAPDPFTFPEFDDSLRLAMQRETEMLFESQLREDRGVPEILTADYTFLNERLAKHYGVPNIHGSQFRRVTLTDDRRKGLLGQASILTITSYGTRTAPTRRGKWLLENLLGAPPPPPPPEVVSDLGATTEDTKHLSVRQRMEKHRANPVCASCHAPMDPLGFALENFDAIGQWRATEAGASVDASGVLPDGTKFSGPAELRTVLAGRSEEFVSTVAEKLLTYGLGRGVEYYDYPAVRKIVREASTDNYRWSRLILAIVKSAPFQMRRAES